MQLLDMLRFSTCAEGGNSGSTLNVVCDRADYPNNRLAPGAKVKRSPLLGIVNTGT